MRKLLLKSCLLFFISIASLANPIIHEEHFIYPISGTTAEQLRDQIIKLGPVDHGIQVDSMTHWSIQWHYTWHYDNPAQNPCYVTQIQVIADITYTLPKWTNIQDGDSALQARWMNYINNLITHEEGHVDNAKRGANEIEQALLSTPPASNCQTLQEELDNAAKSILQQHKDSDTQYDAETNHGRTQGAVFP